MVVKKGRYIKEVLGVKVEITRYEQVLNLVQKWMASNRGGRYIVTLNPEMVMLGQKDEGFRQILNQADLVIADGVGVAWVAKTEKITGVEVMMGLIELGADKGWRVGLLGGKPGVAKQAAQKLKQRFKGLKVMGWAGPEDISKASKRGQKATIDMINQFRPDLLLVAFGHGKQEKWIAENLEKMRVKVAMGVGGALDYLVKPWLRAPKVVQKLGLEWLWRLVLQPWRIKRQLELIKFGWLVLMERK